MQARNMQNNGKIINGKSENWLRRIVTNSKLPIKRKDNNHPEQFPKFTSHLSKTTQKSIQQKEHRKRKALKNSKLGNLKNTDNSWRCHQKKLHQC